MTVADLAIIGIMVLSGVLALMRGFTREVFSIVSWAGAAFLTLWLFPPLTNTGRHVFGFIHSVVIRDVATGLIIFLIALIALSYITSKVTERCAGADPGPWTARRASFSASCAASSSSRSSTSSMAG